MLKCYNEINMATKLKNIIISLFFILPLKARAVELENPLKAGNIADLLKNIVDFLIEMGAYVFVIMMLIGAGMMMVAGGNPEKIKTAKKTILYTIIGYAIILLGWGMVTIIQEILGTKPTQ